MPTYIINPNHYFFEVRDGVTLDLEDLKRRGCEICPNIQLMYESVCATTGQDLDEIEAGEFVIKRSADDHLLCIDARGVVDYVEDTSEYARGGIEEYITDYVL